MSECEYSFCSFFKYSYFIDDIYSWKKKLVCFSQMSDPLEHTEIDDYASQAYSNKLYKK